MDEEGWLSAGAAAVLAREYASHQRGFLEPLARQRPLQQPGQVEVTRRGGLLARVKPVTEVRIELGDHRYTLADTGRGGLVARRALVKREIVLRTDEIPIEDWIAEVGAALDEHARRSEAAASAMRRFFGA
jgi:hypothetical protein